MFCKLVFSMSLPVVPAHSVGLRGLGSWPWAEESPTDGKLCKGCSSLLGWGQGHLMFVL